MTITATNTIASSSITTAVFASDWLTFAIHPLQSHSYLGMPLAVNYFRGRRGALGQNKFVILHKTY